MANRADYKLYTTPTVVHEAKFQKLFQRIREAGYTKIHVLEKWMTFAPTDSEAEVRVNYTTLFDGVATPAVFYVDSSDNAQDKAGGTGALTVTVFYTDSDDHLWMEETITLNGTTPVTSVDKAEHINEAKNASYGTDGNPTGTIQVINSGDTEVYATIANTDHCTVNARTYIPSGYDGYLVAEAKANYMGIPTAATGLSTSEGATVRFRFVTLDANEPTDLAIMKMTVIQGQGWGDVTPPQIVRAGGTDEYVTCLLDIVDEDVNGEVNLFWTIIAWT